MDKVIVIAEAGVNHNGDYDTAKKLIDVASDAKADYVKFQTFNAKDIVSKDASKAKYQISNTQNFDDSQLTMLKRLELPYEWHKRLINYSNSKNIKFLSTGFDLKSIDFLDSLGLPLFKIPSGEITNKPYLRHLAKKKKRIIISTGMANMTEIKAALSILMSEGVDKDLITILHCSTEYPTQMKDVNLKAMLSIQEELGVKVGYSDHTLGIEVPVAAVALGAKVIEKHFTLDRLSQGPDHAASIEPDELKKMVISIRNVEEAILGDGIKRPSFNEKKNINVVRKSIHFSRDLKTGEIISEKDLICLRPGDGVSPMNWDDIIGMKINVDVKKHTKLKWESLNENRNLN